MGKVVILLSLFFCVVLASALETNQDELRNICNSIMSEQTKDIEVKNKGKECLELLHDVESNGNKGSSIKIRFLGAFAAASNVSGHLSSALDNSGSSLGKAQYSHLLSLTALSRESLTKIKEAVLEFNKSLGTKGKETDNNTGGYCFKGAEDLATKADEIQYNIEKLSSKFDSKTQPGELKEALASVQVVTSAISLIKKEMFDYGYVSKSPPVYVDPSFDPVV